MASPLEAFDALELRANAAGRGQVITINESDAGLLKKLTPDDLMRRGVTQKTADYICGILASDSAPFGPLGDLLSVQIRISNDGDNPT